MNITDQKLKDILSKIDFLNPSCSADINSKDRYQYKRNIKLDNENQAFFKDVLKTTIRYLLIKKFVYNLDSFETSPVVKHAEHATSKFTTGRNGSYLVRKAAAFLFEIKSCYLIV